MEPSQTDQNEKHPNIMNLPDRGPSRQSSIEKRDSQSDSPFTIERPLPRKATLNPNSLPHRDDTSDDYYLGDLYDNKINRDEWAIDTSTRPYLQHVKDLCEGWPHIAWLADFMEIGTSPLKFKHLNKAEIEARAKRTRLAVLDFSPTSKPTRKDWVDVQHSKRLTQMLESSTLSQDPEFARIIVVEDLSRDVIEALGAKFDIDPLFFRSQISDYLWFKTRDPWVELNDLEHIACERNYFNIRYMRPRYFTSEDSINDAKTELGSFNVLRRMEQDLSWKVRKKRNPKGPTVGVVRSKAGVWIRENQPGERGVVAILLIDPTLKERPGSYPLWEGPRNLQPCPSIHTKPPPETIRRSSLFEDIIHYTMKMSEADLTTVESQNRAMSIPILSLVAAEWLTVVNYITTGLMEIEWTLEHPDYRKDDLGLDGALELLHPVRRLLPTYRNFIKETLTTILAPSNLKSTPENPCHLRKLRSEFESILDRIERLQIRTQSIVSLATTIISIEENKRAMKMNSNLVRVTYLAVVFVPIQFVSSFFSMTPDLGSLKQTFWIYFVIAIPLTLLCLTIADPHRVVKGLKQVGQKFGYRGM